MTIVNGKPHTKLKNTLKRIQKKKYINTTP